MRRLFLYGVTCLLVVVGLARGVASLAGERPHQFENPRHFWMNKKVFQKMGIVVEDGDYIVRRRYWVLDRSVTGQVVDVEVLSDDQVFLKVQFEGVTAGWQEHGINMQNRRVTTSNRRVSIRPDSYGDGANIESDEVTFSYDIQGDQVEPARCGLIEPRDGPAVRVRFPVHLVSLEPLRKGDEVIRSWDWHDGFADGGEQPEGPHSDGVGDSVGTVISERNEAGFVGVKWHKTGRRKSHRFDHHGFYDIEKVP